MLQYDQVPNLYSKHFEQLQASGIHYSKMKWLRIINVLVFCECKHTDKKKKWQKKNLKTAYNRLFNIIISSNLNKDIK